MKIFLNIKHAESLKNGSMVLWSKYLSANFSDTSSNSDENQQKKKKKCHHGFANIKLRGYISSNKIHLQRIATTEPI